MEAKKEVATSQLPAQVQLINIPSSHSFNEGKRRQIRVERWLEQLALEERGTKGGEREVWQEGGLRWGRGGQQWGGGGLRRREREEKQRKERKTREDKSFDVVSQ